MRIIAAALIALCLSVGARAQIAPVWPSLVLTPGGVPSPLANGQIWTTSAGVFVRVAGVTVGPLASSSASGSPGGATNSVQLNAGGGVFGGVSLGSAQVLVGQASGPPLAQSITGCTLTAAGLLTCPNSTITLTGGATGTGTSSIAVTLGNPGPSTLGGIESIASVSHQFITAISTSGVPSLAQPVFADLASTPTTLGGYGITNGATNGANSNITSLTGLTTPLSVAQGGTGTASPGLVQGANITITGSWPNQTITASSSAGSAFNSITGGTNTTAAMIVGAGGSLSFTSTGIVNANELGGVALLGGTLTNGDFCTYASGGTLLNCNTGSSGSGNVVLANSPTLVTPALGTPSALVGTNISGTASGLTAGTATAANGLNSATTTVVINGATAPTNGQVLTASSGTLASWQTPSGGSGLTVNSTLISGGAANKVLIDDGTKLQELTYGLTGNSVIVETTSGGLLTASILPLGTNTTVGAVKGDGQSVCVTAGVAAACAPNRSTSTSPIVVATTDYNGQINWTGSSAGTVSNFSAPGTGVSVALCNQSSAALTLPTAPAINGYTGTTLPAVTGGTAACINLISNGTSMDAQASVPSTGAVSSTSNSDGTLTVSPTTGAVVASLNLSHANVWAAQQSATITSLTISTATFTPTGASNDYAITLIHASCPCTLANPSGTPVAGTHGIITVTQSSTGSDTIGTYGSEYEAPGGTGSITLSTGANALDTLSYLVKDSTHILLFPALNFSH